jgi:hypothetical protein
MTLQEAFGERLLIARFNYRHISQEVLAERAGIHRTQISMFRTATGCRCWRRRCGSRERSI